MEETQARRRYALYFAPSSGTGLDELGRTWLGRDSRTGEQTEPELPASIDRPSWRAATEAPRRYGFHATLKPPFRLADHGSPERLEEGLEQFAGECKPFELPKLKVGRLGSFLALILTEPCDALHELAADCVTRFDGFRAAQEPSELERRLRSTHTPAERANLERWGYPYVRDTWNFHMTLTGSLSPEVLPRFESHLQERCRAVCAETQRCDAVCLFVEPEPHAPLRLLRSYPLCG
jgi:putative phosphonate metabolism protein